MSEKKDSHGFVVCASCGQHHPAGCVDHRTLLGAWCDADRRALVSGRDALRAEVERLREALRKARWAMLAPPGDVKINGRWTMRRDIDAECEAALASAPPAKASALDAAIEAWRGLSEGRRDAWMYVVAQSDDDGEIEAAALALLRAAAVKP